MFRWYRFVLAAAFALALAPQASAQSASGDPGSCFQSFYWPGVHVGISTHVHYNDTGEDRWYWNEAWDYVDNGAVGYEFGPASNNNNASCEGDDYGDFAGDDTWNFEDYLWFHIPIQHTELADAYSLVRFQSPPIMCNTQTFPDIVEEGVFYEYPNTPFYEGTYPPPLGFAPIALNDHQAVDIPFGQNSYNVYAYTCGSTTPGGIFTQYVWKTFIFGVYYGQHQWFNWNDWTSFPEHNVTI